MKKYALFVALAILILLSAFAAPAVGPAQADPGLVGAAGNRFQAEGRNFFLLGVNYVGGPDRSWKMWQDGLFDVGLIEQDFLKAKAAGLNTLRLFVRPPLQQELSAGNWRKLDSVVSLAEKHGLYLIVTLYDYREDDLAKVAALDRAIASRYANRRIILAYDLRNEPHYQNLAIAQYPGSPPPLQTDALIKHYGQRASQQEADAWRQSEEGRSLIPARFSSRDTYIYLNNYRLYTEFLREAGQWVTARNYEVSTLDYIESPDSAKWRPLLDALNQTLAAWLKPQIEAVRAGDRQRLITVGYSDAVLARLAANDALSFVSIHRFPNIGLKPLLVVFDLLSDVRRAFPTKPVVFEEFGYSNVNADPKNTAVYETALVLYLLSQGMAGGAKWSMYDVAEGWDAWQMNLGLFHTDRNAKPAVQALQALGEYVKASQLPMGQLAVEAEPGGPGLRYVYSATDALFVAAPRYDDAAGRLAFEAPSTTQVFLSWPSGNEISIVVTSSLTLRLNPGALVGAKILRNLTLEKADGTPVPFERQGEAITFATEAGQTYRLKFTPLAIDARIQIVWPHGGKPVSQAERANIGAYLFERDTRIAISPQLAPTVRLWRALNNGVEEEVALGAPRARTHSGLTFNAWDFNNVDVSAAKDKRNKYYFRLSVDGYPHRSSIWSHGEDARTYMPNQDVPVGLATSVPNQIDAKIEIVWPHGGLPVDKATKVNIGAYLFQRGTLQSVPSDWSPIVRLWRTLNNGCEEEVAVGTKVLKKVGNLTFPSWEFNNVDVSAARDRLNKYYFRLTVDGVDTRSNIWAHGADARTYFPQQDVPTGVGPSS